MALQIRRGNTSERVAATPADGEISWDKTLKQLFVGEIGSPNVWTNALSTAGGVGLQWNSGTSKLDVTGAGFNSDVIIEGSTNRFFTNERAQDAAASLFTTSQYILNSTPTVSGTGPYFVTYYFPATSVPGTTYQYTVAGAANAAFNGTKTATASSTTSITLSYAANPGSWTSGGTVTITSVIHTGIKFTYADVNDKLLATVISSTSLVADPSPTLGANLTLNSYSITGTGAISITGAISGTTISAATGLGAGLSLNGNNITGTGNINTTGNITASGTLTATTGLGANLSLNGNNITGTGIINIAGAITGTAITGTTINAATGLGANLPLNGYNINGTGNINTTGNITASGTLTATTGLGANLPLNSYNITGTGNINTTGNISASGTLTATTGLGANLSLNGYNITGTGDINANGNITANTVTAGAYGLITDTIGTTGLGSITVQSLNTEPLQIRGITDGTGNIPFVTLRASKGTISVPTNLSAGDIMGGYQIKGYGNGTYQTAAAMISKWATPTVDFTKTYPGSQLLIVVGNNSSSPAISTFDGMTGVFTAPALATTVYSAAGTAIPSAATLGAGSRAFVSDATAATFGTTYTSGGSNKVPVYSDGTAWKIG